MASDDSENYKASQSAHAQKIRTERAIQKVTGLPVSAIRAGLREYAQQVAQLRGQQQPLQDAGRPPAPKIEEEQVQMRGQWVQDKNPVAQERPPQAGGGGIEGGIEVEVTGVLNGVPASGVAWFATEPEEL